MSVHRYTHDSWHEGIYWYATTAVCRIYIIQLQYLIMIISCHINQRHVAFYANSTVPTLHCISQQLSLYVSYMGTYLVQTTTSWKPVQTTAKKLYKFIKKITHVDDMMIYNFVKYLVQTRLRLWDKKITNFKPESCPSDLLDTFP